MPELIEHGVTGFLIDHPDEAPAAVGRSRTYAPTTKSLPDASSVEVLTGTVVDVLRALAETGPATTVSGWGNVHVGTPRELVQRPRRRTPGPEVGAEIFLTYTRGERVLAAAGRVEAAAGRWRWVAFTTAA